MKISFLIIPYGSIIHKTKKEFLKDTTAKMPGEELFQQEELPA